MTNLKQIAEDVCGQLQEQLGDNLALLAITGSVSRGETIPGWSDVDILCIVDRLDDQTYTIIRDALGTTDAAVGVTMYTCDEFQLGTTLDTKTKLNTYYIQHDSVRPLFARAGLRLPEQTPEELLTAELLNFGTLLHSARRQLLLGSAAYNEQKLVKMLYVLYKILVHVRSHNLRPMGYTPGTEITAYTTDIAIPHPREILNDPAGSVRRYDTYVQLIDILVQRIDEEVEVRV